MSSTKKVEAESVTRAASNIEDRNATTDAPHQCGAALELNLHSYKSHTELAIIASSPCVKLPFFTNSCIVLTTAAQDSELYFFEGVIKDRHFSAGFASQIIVTLLIDAGLGSFIQCGAPSVQTFGLLLCLLTYHMLQVNFG